MARAEEIEAEATQRAIVLANQARCPLGVTPVTSKSSAKAISEAKRRGMNIYCATLGCIILGVLYLAQLLTACRSRLKILIHVLVMMAFEEEIKIEYFHGACISEILILMSTLSGFDCCLTNQAPMSVNCRAVYS